MFGGCGEGGPGEGRLKIQITKGATFLRKEGCGRGGSRAQQCSHRH